MKKHTWYEGMGRFEIGLTQEQADDMSRPGEDASDACAHWAKLVTRPRKCTIAALRDALSDSGGWDDSELLDDSVNWERILWIASCDTREQVYRECAS